MFVFSLFLSVFAGNFVEVGQAKTLDLAEANGINLVVTKKKEFFCADYWGSAVYHLNRDGTLRKKIARSGQGPGEVIKPTYLFIMDYKNRESLLCIDNYGKWSLFDAASGNFIKVITKYLPAVKWKKIDSRHVLGVKNNTNKFFIKVNLEGEIVESWGEKPKENPEEFWSRRYASAVGKDEKVYFQEGAQPVVEVYDKAGYGFKERRLPLPKDYRHPPDKPFNIKKVGTDFQKIKAFCDSYTQVKNFEIFNDKYLLVQWALTSQAQSIDLIELKSWRRVVENFTIPEEFRVCLSGENLYVVGRQEYDQIGTSDAFMVKTYKFKP